MQPCSVGLRIVERPSCRKRQLTGHFPDLCYRLVLGRASGCKNFCLKKSSQKWGTSGHPHWQGQDQIKIRLLLLHLRDKNIKKCLKKTTVSKDQDVEKSRLWSLDNTRPRVEFQTCQQRSGRNYHQPKALERNPRYWFLSTTLYETRGTGSSVRLVPLYAVLVPL